MTNNYRKEIMEQTVIERHIKTIIAAIILGALTWSASTTYQNSLTLARIDFDHRMNNNVVNLKDLERRIDQIEATRWTEDDNKRAEIYMQQWVRSYVTEHLIEHSRLLNDKDSQ